MMNGGDDSANGSADSHHKAEYAAEDEFDDDAAERKADELDAAETGGVSEKGGDGGGMRVTFQNIVYTVTNRADKKSRLDILKDISGFFNRAEMTAVMGPSGSGKSTLLDLLAGRKNQGELRGEVRFAGRKPSKTFLRRFTGYVEQFDTLLPELTVTEMLMYTAELKRKRREPLAQKKERVDRVINSLALQSCRNTHIGSVLARGISGGEAKRTNVGIALVSNPRVLFLDEPTSGLDSYTASEVMEVVKSLTATGITICATIHSPSPRTFELFERVLILQRGRVVYFGDNGDAATAYFMQTLPECRQIRHHEAVAEYIVDITTQADRAGRADQFGDLYNASQLKAANMADLGVAAQQGSARALQRTATDLDVRRGTTVPSWWAFWILIKYRSSRNFRSIAFLGARLGDKILFTFIILTLWWRTGSDYSDNSALQLSGIFYYWITLPAFGAAAYIPSIVLERPVYLRETADGLFKPVIYLTHKILEETVLSVAMALVFSMLVYIVVDLAGNWWVFMLTFLLTLTIGVVVAYFIAAVSPNMEIANTALPAYIVTLLFFIGFLPRWTAIHWYWRWYAYLNPLHYSWGALMINAFEGRNVQISGSETLEYFSLSGINKWAYVGYESLFFVGFFFAAWAALQFIRYDKR